MENVLFDEGAAIKTFEKALDSGDLCLESSRIFHDHLKELRASCIKFESLEENEN